jgi:hypothetical protein
MAEFVRFVRAFWFPFAMGVLVVLGVLMYAVGDQFETAFWVVVTVVTIIIVVPLIPKWIRGLSFLWKTRKRSCPGCGQRVQVLPGKPVCPRCGYDFRTSGGPPQQ